MKEHFQTIYEDPKIANLPRRWWDWYFPDGAIDKAHVDPVWAWKRYGLPEKIENMRFFDLGCWDGGTCFEAARRGASEVFGLDSHVWERDPQIYSNFLWAKEKIAPSVKGAFVEIEPVPSRLLTPDSKIIPSKHTLASFGKTYGTADIVLAAGILYHLIDPIRFLIDLKAVVLPNTGRLYLTTWCTRKESATADFIPGWKGDSSNYWLFSILCLKRLLYEIGYEVIDTQEVISSAEPLISFICRPLD